MILAAANTLACALLLLAAPAPTPSPAPATAGPATAASATAGPATTAPAAGTPAAAATTAAPTQPGAPLSAISGSSSATPAGAASPATAAATPPPAPPASKADPKQFDAALKEYFGGSTEDAARDLYAYVEGSPTTDENHAWAEYFLARTLVDLGLRQAGATYLAKVARERSNPQVLPRALEALHRLTEVPHDEFLIDQQTFGSLDLGFLPPDVENYVNYEQGLYDLKVGNNRWANTHFRKLTQGTSEASRAKFAVLVNKLKKEKDVSKETVEAFLALSQDDKLTEDAHNEAKLAVARLRYEQKDFKGALAAYESVKLPPLDPGRATLYLEEAWTRYRLGEVRASMGLLQTLDAPSFRDAFLPDKYLLRGMIYRDLCHYLPAKRAAKELVRHYADSLEAIHERDDLTQDLHIRRAAEAEGATQKASKFLTSLNLETERLGHFAGSFGDRLFSHLAKLYALESAEATRHYDEQLDQSVRDVADKLLTAAEQERLLEYEVGLKLYERIKKGAIQVVSPTDPKIGSDKVVFPFDGEYWNDELRDYRVSLKSRCVEEDAR